jgi:hypothetical protein
VFSVFDSLEAQIDAAIDEIDGMHGQPLRRRKAIQLLHQAEYNLGNTTNVGSVNHLLCCQALLWSIL